MAYFWQNPTGTLLENRRWSYAERAILPDSAYLHVDKSRVQYKDEFGRSHPLDTRYLPVKDARGRYDCAHIRNAVARAPQTALPRAVQKKLQDKARRLLVQHCGERPFGR